MNEHCARLARRTINDDNFARFDDVKLKLSVARRKQQVAVLISMTFGDFGELLKLFVVKFRKRLRIFFFDIRFRHFLSHSQALDLLGSKLELEQGNKLLLYLYGYLQQANKNNAKAISAYNTALEKDPNFFDAMYKLGLAFVEASTEELKVKSGKKVPK
mgnify:CR=1 FL=1